MDAYNRVWKYCSRQQKSCQNSVTWRKIIVSKFLARNSELALHFSVQLVNWILQVLPLRLLQMLGFKGVANAQSGKRKIQAWQRALIPLHLHARKLYFMVGKQNQWSSELHCLTSLQKLYQTWRWILCGPNREDGRSRSDTKIWNRWGFRQAVCQDFKIPWHDLYTGYNWNTLKSIMWTIVRNKVEQLLELCGQKF